MPVQTRTLEDYVEEFERAHQARRGGCSSSPTPPGVVDLRAFLPPPDDPLHRSVLRELIRIELELGWESGRPRSLDDYRQDFPNLFDDPASVEAIAFEEYRLRRQAGQKASRLEYARRYGVRTDGWPGGADEGEVSLSVQMEQAARTFRAFCLAPVGGQSVRVDDWRAPAGTDSSVVRLFRDLHAASPAAALDLASGLCAMPEAGETFLGFHLSEELGRGAFGRVFLARQAALADRPVALKVAADVGAESQTLARLAHTHIVPIYSVHRAGPLQAVCMPYWGNVTVADVLRDQRARLERPSAGLDLLRLLARKPRPAGVTRPEGPCPAVAAVLGGRTYPEAVLWLGARLAEALHHAHERDILHQDVKPANILLSDEGLPVLLDFNVAEDVRQRGAAAALVGGTLPYMAPEHLELFRGKRGAIDGRSDVYSLGIVLFELLADRFPFPRVAQPPDQDSDPAAWDRAVARMLEDRRAGAPDPREFNPELSAATAAIVRHCLQPDPARRYPSALALQEDLERQLSSRPLLHAPEPSLVERLGKWRRRHPGLAIKASVAVALVLVVLAGMLGRWGMRLHRAEQARAARTKFAAEYREALFKLSTRPEDSEQQRQAEQTCRQALARYGLPEDARWQERSLVTALEEREQRALLGEVGELLLVLARTVGEKPKADCKEESTAEALELNRLAESAFSAEDQPPELWRQRALLLARSGDSEGAKEAKARAESLPVESLRARTLEARRLTHEGRFRDALPLLTGPSVRETPDHFWAWFLLGVCHQGMGHSARAVTCYTTCIALVPGLADPYRNRGLAYYALGEIASARVDFDRAIALAPERAETYVDRARAREALADLGGAESDLTTAVERGYADTLVHYLRARVRRRAGKKKEAQADREVLRKREPTSELGWIARGLDRMGEDAAGALADFDRALSINPTSRAALRNKAHVLAEKQNQQKEAAAVLERVLELYPDHSETLSGLAVVLARLGRRAEALKRLDAALLRDTRPPVRYQGACACALTSREVPADADTAIVHLRAALLSGYGIDKVQTDADLAPLRRKPAFKQLVRLAELMREQRAARNRR
jgi:serine/threonine protein kinase/tetratricopeptide (TPR) repeat protein